MYGHIVVLYGILMLRTINTEKILGVEIEMKEKVVMNMDEKEIIIKFKGEKLLEQQALIKKILITKNRWMNGVTDEIAGNECKASKTGILEKDCGSIGIDPKILRLQKELYMMAEKQVHRYEKNMKDLEKFMWKYESIRLDNNSRNQVKELFNGTVQKMIKAKAKEDCVHLVS